MTHADRIKEIQKLRRAFATAAALAKSVLGGNNDPQSIAILDNEIIELNKSCSGDKMQSYQDLIDVHESMSKQTDDALVKAAFP